MVQPLLIALPLSARWGAGMVLRVPKSAPSRSSGASVGLLLSLSHSQLTPGSSPGSPASKHLSNACALRIRVPTLLTDMVRMLSSRSSAPHFPQILCLLFL